MFNKLISSWDKAILYEELENLKKFCLDKNFGYYPQLLRRLPQFSLKVNQYIKNKSKQDLPSEQFDRDFFSRDISKLVEIGGALDFNGKLTELFYSPPDVNNVVIEQDIYQGRGSPTFEYTSQVIKVLPNKIVRDSSILIDWHSHPNGYGEPSNDDMENLKEFLEVRGDKPYYFLLFQPHLGQTFWYQIKKHDLHVE